MGECTASDMDAADKELQYLFFFLLVFNLAAEKIATISKVNVKLCQS